MKTRKLSLLGLILASIAVPAVLSIQAQDSRPEAKVATPTVAIQDALNKPFSFPFADETPISEVAAYLHKTLHAEVVIDRAALDRIGIDAKETVVLKLDGVRLKVGLKLLLDQLEMTYRVEPEDNLLILTDATGSGDPIDRIASELKALHRDVHDVQDALDEIRAALGLEEEDGPKMRKPAIIEEPGKPGAKPKDEPANPTKPRHSGA
jgi:hypothetical protein